MERRMIYVMMLVVVSCAVLAQDNAYLKSTLLNQDPDPAEPGNYVEVRWKVEKFGNDPLGDVKYLLEPDYPFSFDMTDTAEKSVGTWVGYSDDEAYYTLYYKLLVADDALEGSYDVTLKYSVNDNPYVEVGEYQIRVADAEKPKFVLGNMVTSPGKLISDIEEAELKVAIENIGDGTAENTKVEIELPEGFEPSYSYSDQSVLGTINAGGSEEATFYMDVDEGVSGGVYDANVRISYTEANDDDNEYRFVEMPMHLTVKHSPEFEITRMETTPAEVHPGDTVELKVAIENTGGKEAESVSVRAFKDSSQPFEFDEKSDFIGKLESGEEGEAVIRMDVEEDAALKEYILDLEIRAIDGTEVIVQDNSISLEVLAPEKGARPQAASPLVGAGLIVAIVAVGLIGYAIGTKKGKK